MKQVKTEMQNISASKWLGKSSLCHYCCSFPQLSLFIN